MTPNPEAPTTEAALIAEAQDQAALSTLQALLEAARELVAAMDAYEADAGSEMESCWERVEAALTATRAALQETAQ